MPWSKSLDRYPQSFFVVLEGVVSTGKPVILTFKDIKKASYERMRWGAFFSALRHNAHPLSAFVEEISIFLGDADKSTLYIVSKKTKTALNLLDGDEVYEQAARVFGRIAITDK